MSYPQIARALGVGQGTVLRAVQGRLIQRLRRGCTTVGRPGLLGRTNVGVWIFGWFRCTPEDPLQPIHHQRDAIRKRKPWHSSRPIIDYTSAWGYPFPERCSNRHCKWMLRKELSGFVQPFPRS
jgi:hypothetical protein